MILRSIASTSTTANAAESEAHETAKATKKDAGGSQEANIN